MLAVVPSLVVSNLRLPLGVRVDVEYLAVALSGQEELPLGYLGCSAKTTVPGLSPLVRTASSVKCPVGILDLRNY